MLADWVATYGCHPLRNDFTQAERDMLTEQLLRDPRSRISTAAMAEVPLELWAQLRTASMVAAALGVELDLPYREQPKPRPDKAALAEAHAALTRASAIANLPE